jgi:hypothetical protein
LPWDEDRPEWSPSISNLSIENMDGKYYLSINVVDPLMAPSTIDRVILNISEADSYLTIGSIELYNVSYQICLNDYFSGIMNGRDYNFYFSIKFIGYEDIEYSELIYWTYDSIIGYACTLTDDLRLIIEGPCNYWSL